MIDEKKLTIERNLDELTTKITFEANETMFKTVSTRRLFIIKNTSESFNFKDSSDARLLVIKNMSNILIIESILMIQISAENILLKKRKRRLITEILSFIIADKLFLLNILDKSIYKLCNNFYNHLDWKILASIKSTDKTFFEKNFYMFYSTYFNEEFFAHCIFFNHDVYRLLLRRQNSIMKNSNFF